MSLPNVTINLASGQLGQSLATADGVAGIVLTGSTQGSITAGVPFRITSLAAATTLGLTSAGNAFAYKEIKEFYDEGRDGAALWVMLVPSTMTMAQMVDKTNANGLIKLLDAAAGEVTICGVSTDGAVATHTVTNGINADAYAAITALPVLATYYAFTRQAPFRCLVAGAGFTGTASALTSQTGNNVNRGAILIGDTVNTNKGACIGLALGRLAVSPVQRKISRVKSGRLLAPTLYVGATDAGVYQDAETIHDKYFITIRTFPRKTGYFFTGDRTCTSSTDDYNMIARGRVIDKAHRIAYTTFVEEIDDEVPVDATTGKMAAGYCKTLEQKIINQIQLTMQANSEISAVTCFIDPNQNVLSTGQVKVKLGIIPVGYASAIVVDLAFVNPALQ